MKKTQFYVGKLASKKHVAAICQLRRLLILALTTKKTGKRQNKSKNQQKQTTYVGNPACKKQCVTNCQPTGSRSDKVVEKNIESVQIISTLNPKLTFKKASLDFKPPQADIFLWRICSENNFKKNLKFQNFGR